jgi:hypothetical protein
VAFSLIVMAQVVLVFAAAALLEYAVRRSQPRNRTFPEDGVAAGAFVAPKHARFPPSWREWAVRTAVVAGIVAATVVPVAWWLGVWGGYEHQLKVAVRAGHCVRISTDRQGWAGTGAVLNARASARFAAFCDELGPSATWLHFHSADDMRRAIVADAADRDPLLTGDYTSVCINRPRAELVAFDDVAQWKVKVLCWLRGGQIVRRPTR